MSGRFVLADFRRCGAHVRPDHRLGKSLRRGTRPTGQAGL